MACVSVIYARDWVHLEPIFGRHWEMFVRGPADVSGSTYMCDSLSSRLFVIKVLGESALLKRQRVPWAATFEDSSVASHSILPFVSHALPFLFALVEGTFCSHA